MSMNKPTLIQNQLLATKFYVPVALGPLISRPRLTTLLDKSFKHPFTLVSAPAGFGKTTLLASWSQSLPKNHQQVAWISLDEEDNDPRLFWIYVLAALKMQRPERFTGLLTQMQAPVSPPLKSVLGALINLLAEGTDDFLLILDDYQVITEPEVHTTLTYLIEHLPAQLHIIMATRADPPLPLLLLKTRVQMLEIRTSQLHCTVEETGTFFHEVMGIQLPNETIQQVTIRTEGWLVGLQLLGLSLPEQADPLSLLQEISGDQHYILDYLTEVVLQQQPQEIQTFLLGTSILDQLNASLCDAVLQQHGSQQMLQRLDQSNLFVISLDNRRLWYRYHALFAQALRYRLEETHSDLVPILHHRASLWYAQHDQTTQAIVHAFHARQYQLAADLIERNPLLSLSWGASRRELAMLEGWLEQLPREIMQSRPRLCLASAQLLWAVAPYPQLEAWLDMAQARLLASLANEDILPAMPSSKMQMDQKNLLGEVIAWRAWLRCYQEDGEPIFLLCQQSLDLLSAENGMFRAIVESVQFQASYPSCATDTLTAFETKLQAQVASSAPSALTIAVMALVALYMMDAGQLKKAYNLIKQTHLLGTYTRLMLPDMGYLSVLQGEILRQWNDLDAARSLIEEAIPLCKQIVSIGSMIYQRLAHAMLLRVLLSRRELNEARLAYQEFERIGMGMNQPMYIYSYSHFTTIDQVRLWLACGELDHAIRWMKQMDAAEQPSHPLFRQRQEIACVRILLAQTLPAVALKRLEPLLEIATKTQHWGRVIEIRLLQALAYQMCHEEVQALAALTEALHLAEPEGYIRSFVDEGPPMEALLYQMRKRDHKSELIPYLDILLAAFKQESKAHTLAKEGKAQLHLEPLSERELEVLQLMAKGASNQEIAQQLVIAYDTVKRHVSHIFSKLGVQNRIQAVRQAQEFGLLEEEL